MYDLMRWIEGVKGEIIIVLVTVIAYVPAVGLNTIWKEIYGKDRKQPPVTDNPYFY